MFSRGIRLRGSVDVGGGSFFFFWGGVLLTIQYIPEMIFGDSGLAKVGEGFRVLVSGDMEILSTSEEQPQRHREHILQHTEASTTRKEPKQDRSQLHRCTAVMAPSELANGKKRKRSEVTKSTSTSKKGKNSSPKPTSKVTSSAVASIPNQDLKLTQSRILELEELIIESPRNYNHIVTLLTSLQDFASPSLGITSAVSLCRTFCRLLAIGRMKKKDTDTPAEAKLLVWLKERYKDYLKELVRLLGSGELSYQTTVLTLFMKLVKEEGAHLKGPGDDYFFPHDLMARIAKGVLYTDFSEGTTLRDEFVQKWLDEYHDVRYSFLFVTL